MTIAVYGDPLLARIFRVYDGVRPAPAGPVTNLIYSTKTDGFVLESGRTYRAESPRHGKVVRTAIPTWFRAFAIDGTTPLFDGDYSDFAGSGDVQSANLPITASPLTLQKFDSVGMVESFLYRKHGVRNAYKDVVFVWDGNSIDCAVPFPVGHFPPGMSMPDQFQNYLSSNGFPSWTVHGTGVPGRDIAGLIANFSGAGRPASFVNPAKKNIYLWHEVLNQFANNPGTTVPQVVAFAQQLYQTAIAAGFDEVWWLDTAFAFAPNFTPADWTGSNLALHTTGQGTAYTAGRDITWSTDVYAGSPAQNGSTDGSFGANSSDAAYWSSISDMFIPDGQHPGDPAARVGVAVVADMVNRVAAF